MEQKTFLKLFFLEYSFILIPFSEKYHSNNQNITEQK